MTKVQGELFPVLEQIERDKGIKKEEIIRMIELALVSAFRKHSGRMGDIRAKIDSETAEVKVYVVKKVVSEVKSPQYEISFEEAKKFSPEVKTDSEIELPIETEEFSRIAAQTAKQVIIQKIREIERENLFQEFLTKKNQVLTGFVHRFVDHNIIVDLGKAEAILPLREQVRRERFNIGERLKVYILKVEKGSRGPQILVSRTHPELVKQLFTQEVPEVHDHTVEIVSISREPGYRSKIAVVSHNEKVDPVGACIGVKGSRIRPIIEELRGERIDLIRWDTDPSKLIAQSLTPAKVSTASVINAEEKRVEVIVADDQLSLAIGKSGQNVRLASRLTGWHIDIKSESSKKEQIAKETIAKVNELQKISGIGPKLADVLQKAGYKSIEDLANTKIEQLIALQGIGKKTGTKIIRLANEYLTSVKDKENG